MNRGPRSITVHIEELAVHGLDHRSAAATAASLGETLEVLLGGNAARIRPPTRGSDAHETRDDPSGPRMLGAAAAQAIRRNLDP